MPPFNTDPSYGLQVLIDISLTVKVATLIFIPALPGRGSAISSAKQGESGSIYNLVKSY